MSEFIYFLVAAVIIVIVYEYRERKKTKKAEALNEENTPAIIYLFAKSEALMRDVCKGSSKEKTVCVAELALHIFALWLLTSKNKKLSRERCDIFKKMFVVYLSENNMLIPRLLDTQVMPRLVAARIDIVGSEKDFMERNANFMSLCDWALGRDSDYMFWAGEYSELPLGFGSPFGMIVMPAAYKSGLVAECLKKLDKESASDKKLLFEYENVQQNENFSCNDEKSTNSEQECKENSTPIENAIDIITFIMIVIVFVSLCFIVGKSWGWNDNFLLALLMFPFPVIIGTIFLSAPILFIGFVLKKALSFIIDKVKISNYSVLGVISFLTLCYIIISQPLEYGFYQVLRWLVCSFSAWTSVKIYQKTPKSFWLMAFVALAVIFNPVLPLKFEDEVWIPIDIVTALIFIAYSIKSVQKTRC